MSAERNVSNGINWDDLPDNANWVAMDRSGVWYWYESVPREGKNCWWPRGVGGTDAFCSAPCDDWTKSLQSRPSPAAAVPIEPLSSAERTVVNAEIESLNEQLKAALARIEELREVLDDGVRLHANDLSWALAQVFQHRKLVTRADMEEASHWRLGLFIPVNSGQRSQQLVWTNGTDWHPCVIDAEDYNGTWKVYDSLD